MSTPNKKTSAQILEENRGRHQSLLERKQRVEVELRAAGHQLAEAQAEAQRDFGTSDLDALRTLYATREQENADKVSAFVAGLDALEQELADVERQLAS